MRLQQPFPVWVRGAPLYIKATAAEPASLVWLGEGSELHISPRPRQRAAPAARQAMAAAALPAAGPTAAPIWLRVQVSCHLWEASTFTIATRHVLLDWQRPRST